MNSWRQTSRGKYWPVVLFRQILIFNSLATARVSNGYITQSEIETILMILMIKSFKGTNNEYLDQCWNGETFQQESISFLPVFETCIHVPVIKLILWHLEGSDCTITVRPNYYTGEPQLIVNPSSPVSVTGGSSVTLECTAAGSPPPVVQWIIEGHPRSNLQIRETNRGVLKLSLIHIWRCRRRG